MVVMISKYKHKGLNWIDLESPSGDEVAYILEEYNIPLFIKEEITSKPKDDIIRLEQGYIFAYLNLARILPDKSTSDRLIFVANDNFVIVIHDKPIQAFGEFSKEMELDIVTEEKFGTNNNKLLFAHLLKSLYVNSQKQLTSDEDKIKIIEKQILNEKKKLKLLIVLSFVLFGAIILIIWL
jgi:Mg2+ and Co2+ transporter CorA